MRYLLIFFIWVSYDVALAQSYTYDSIDYRVYKIYPDYDTIDVSPCEFENIVNTKQKREVMNRYIDKLSRERALVYNKGIIMLYRKSLPKGKEQWMIDFEIDDGYKDKLTKKFSVYSGDIILIYDEGDTLGYDSAMRLDLVNCYNTIIGDRVYIRPEKRWRWNNEIFNSRRMPGAFRDFTGAGWSVLVTFKKDGSYEEDDYFSFERP